MKRAITMKKTATLFVLSLMLAFALCSCNNPKKSSSSGGDSEMEKKVVGKWKFLYTDAGKGEIPPRDLTYILNADHSSTLEFTGEKNEKRQIPGTYEVKEDRLQFFKDGTLVKEFQVQFKGNDTMKLTEMKSKNSMTLARLPQ